jgi:hypothetical protein
MRFRQDNDGDYLVNADLLWKDLSQPVIWYMNACYNSVSVKHDCYQALTNAHIAYLDMVVE